MLSLGIKYTLCTRGLFGSDAQSRYKRLARPSKYWETFDGLVIIGRVQLLRGPADPGFKITTSVIPTSLGQLCR